MQGDEKVLYRGILSDFSLSPTGINFLVITRPAKRKINEKAFSLIGDHDYLVLRYEEILNFTLKHVKVSEIYNGDEV